MIKTAEEVIQDEFGISPGAKPLTPMDYGECLRCMREFAAQEVDKEVEAYKDKLKDAIYERYHEYYKDMRKLIDTVK